MPSTDLLNPVTPVLGGAALSSANAIPVNVISGGGSGITVDTTTITGGTTTRLLYDNGGTVGEAVITYASATAAVGFSGDLTLTESVAGNALIYIKNTSSAAASQGMLKLEANGKSMTFAVNQSGGFLTVDGAASMVTSYWNFDTANFRSVAGSQIIAMASAGVTFTAPLVYGGTTFASTVTGSGSLVGGTNPTLSSLIATGTLTYGGVTLASTVTGTGSMVLSASPSITGTAALAAASHSGLNTFSSQVTVTGALASLFAVGANGATGPAFVVDASQASQASGVKITGSVATNFPTIATVSTSSAGVGLVIDAKGNGSITLANSSTGGINLSTATTISNTLTYGGVTLSSTVTGTGSMVLSAAPSLTGNVTLVSAAATGILTAQNGVAASATGANFGFQMSSTASFGVIWGALGSVAPTIAATQGCLYINTSGSSTATRMYIKASAAGTWTNFTTAA